MGNYHCIILFDVKYLDFGIVFENIFLTLHNPNRNNDKKLLLYCSFIVFFYLFQW